MTAQSTGGITRRTKQTNALFIATLNFLVPCACVCLLSGKCWVCSVTVKRPVLFLAVYTLQGNRNVGQFTPAQHKQFLPESMQPCNCCLNRILVKSWFIISPYQKLVQIYMPSNTGGQVTWMFSSGAFSGKGVKQSCYCQGSIPIFMT